MFAKVASAKPTFFCITLNLLFTNWSFVKLLSFFCVLFCVSVFLLREHVRKLRGFFSTKTQPLSYQKLSKRLDWKKKTLSFLKFSNMLTEKPFVSFYSITELIKRPIFTLCSRNFRYNSMVEEPHDRSDSSSSEDDSDREDCCIMWLANFFPKKDKFDINIDQNT